MTEQDAHLFYYDKKTRNPNWTDGEIVRFLELLQEEDVMRDLLEHSNKQAFCKVADRMNCEGSEKTWDQCRIKLKNLKSQYRCIKDRVPNIKEFDLESDSALKQLTTVCQGRGLSLASLKHLKFLKRFLNKRTSAYIEMQRFASSQMSLTLNPPPLALPGVCSPLSPIRKAVSKSNFTLQPSNCHCNKASFDVIEDKIASLQSFPPSNNANLIQRCNFSNEEMRRAGGHSLTNSTENLTRSVDFPKLDSSHVNFADRVAEKFNRELMDLYLDFQKKSQANLLRWEQERIQREQESHERWRQEAQEHERQIFTMFCSALSHCNAIAGSIIKSSSVTAVQVKHEPCNNQDLDEKGIR